MTLTEMLTQYAQAWREDAKRLRTEGQEKQCEKCLVAAEVYDECASQVVDLLAHTQS